MMPLRDRLTKVAHFIPMKKTCSLNPSIIQVLVEELSTPLEHLPIRLGDKECARNMFVKFLVVKELSAYNVILGRPANPQCFKGSYCLLHISCS